MYDNWWETLLKIPDRNCTIRESIAINDVNILQTLIRHNSKTYSRIILKSISEERVLFQLSNDGFMFSKSFLLLVPTGGSHTVWISTIFEDFDALANINRYDTRVNQHAQSEYIFMTIFHHQVLSAGPSLLKMDSRYSVTGRVHGNTEPGSQLLIHKVRQEDAGEFFCQVFLTRWTKPPPLIPFSKNFGGSGWNPTNPIVIFMSSFTVLLYLYDYEINFPWFLNSYVLQVQTDRGLAETKQILTIQGKNSWSSSV